MFSIKKLTEQKLLSKFAKSTLEKILIENGITENISRLTECQGQQILKFSSLNSLRGAIFKSRYEEIVRSIEESVQNKRLETDQQSTVNDPDQLEIKFDKDEQTVTTQKGETIRFHSTKSINDRAGSDKVQRKDHTSPTGLRRLEPGDRMIALNRNSCVLFSEVFF